MRISKRSVEALPVDPARDRFFWDDNLKGFGVKITRGGRRVYVITGRLSGEKRRWTLGPHGALTADRARQDAAAGLGALARGEDPLQERRVREARGLTVAQLCDRYLAAARSGHVRYRGKRKKASTLATDAGRIERHVRPLLGARKAEGVSRQDIERFRADVAAGKTATVVKTGPRGVARVTGGEGTARRTLGLLGGIFSWAVDEGLVAGNPVAGVERGRDGVRDRHLDHAGYQALGIGLEAAAAAGINPHGLRAIRLLALTGMRRGEALGFRKEYLDRVHRCARLPDTKGGRSIRPLGAAAVAVIDEAVQAAAGSDWIFPSDRSAGHLVGLGKIMSDVAELARLHGVTPNVLRHSFNSTAAAMGVSQSVREALIGQAGGGVNRVHYTHFVDAALVEVADRVAAQIAGALAAGADRHKKKQVD